MIEINNSKCYNISEAAQKLQATPKTVYNLIRKKKLKSVRLGKGSFINQEWLDNYINTELKNTVVYYNINTT